jgi:aryl-alcohol dehydrogenase-like predicted oxidoreductase
MRYRTFGRTGLKVSELVFGGGWVGGVLIHQDDDTKLKVLRYAIDSGINWIDTASKYGNGKSEEALGWLLQELSRRPYVSTKVMLDTSNLDDVAGQVERSTNESLSRMKLDSVDLLQLHNPLGVAAVDPNAGGSAITAEHVLAKNGVADSLDRMREQGLTRYIGFTALGDVASCRSLIDSDRFDSVQVYYNMLNPSAARTMPGSWVGHDFGNLVAACKRQNMATMVIRGLAAGVLASDERHGREVVITRESGLDTESRRAAAVFAALGDEYGSRAQTALRFVLSNADVSCAVFGLAEFAHLREALAAADMGPLPQTAFDKLDQAYANNFNL